MSIQFTLAASAAWMARTASPSSCGPQFTHQVPGEEPIGPVPTPTGVIARSLAPRARRSTPYFNAASHRFHAEAATDVGVRGQVVLSNASPAPSSGPTRVSSHASRRHRDCIAEIRNGTWETWLRSILEGACLPTIGPERETSSDPEAGYVSTPSGTSPALPSQPHAPLAGKE